MDDHLRQWGMSRRRFIKDCVAAAAATTFSVKGSLIRTALADWSQKSLVFKAGGIPLNPFPVGGNHHAGLDTLLNAFSAAERKFYRSQNSLSILAGTDGIIRANDVVVIKVNGQWCFRGSTNTDVLRGFVQRIIEHPDGFTGEIVIIENGQGRGSLNCDQDQGDLGPGVHANALDTSQSFNAIVSMFSPAVRISAYLLDTIRNISISEDEEVRDGYVTRGFVTYPRITTQYGTRIDLAGGIWNGSGYEDRLRLISIPVLKDHGGAQVTGALKLGYGILSMALAPQGTGPYHYTDLGKATGTIWADVRRADMHLIDAIHVVKSGGPYSGTYSESTAPRTATLLASVDPVAADVIASKYVLYPASLDPRHNPDVPGRLKNYLAQAESTMRGFGYNANRLEENIMVADGVRGAMSHMMRKHRDAGASEEEVRRMLQYYYEGDWIW